MAIEHPQLASNTQQNPGWRLTTTCESEGQLLSSPLDGRGRPGRRGVGQVPQRGVDHGGDGLHGGARPPPPQRVLPAGAQGVAGRPQPRVPLQRLRVRPPGWVLQGNFVDFR
jgi:hypothetical protein